MPRSHTRVLLSCVLAISCLLLPQSSCKKKNLLDRVSVRMKWIFNGTTSEWFYGRDQAFFRDQGFKLEIQPGGPGINSVQLVAGGASTFAVTSPEEVIQARAHGLPVRAIAAVFQSNPVRFLVASSSGVSSPADFRDKKAPGEYHHSDSRCLVDLPGIDGNRRLLNRILNCLMYHLNILFESDAHDWEEAKCTRYSFTEEVIAAARELENKSGANGTGTVVEHSSFPSGKGNVLSANLGAHTAPPPWYLNEPSPCSDPDFDRELANIKGDWNWLTD